MPTSAAPTTRGTPRDDGSVIGYMYTTWQQDYSKVEQFAKICRGEIK